MGHKFSNILIAYKILSDLGKKWTEFDAYKLGLIDANGEKIRSPETKEEKYAYDSYYKLIFNLKRILQRFVGKNTTVQKLTTLLLLKEGYDQEKADIVSSKIVQSTMPVIYESENDAISEWECRIIISQLLENDYD